MKFYEKRKGPPIVPIVPMIDILSILLVFFILHFEQDKSKESDKGEITKTEKTVKSGKEEKKLAQLAVSVPKTREMGADQLAEVGLLIRVAKDGQAEISGKRFASVELVVAELVKMAAGREKPKIELEIDEGLSFGAIISLWDSLTKAGYEVKEVPHRVLKADKF